MKSIFIKIIVLCFTLNFASAQTDISSVEYYFDTDPGIGNGTIIDINPDSEIISQNFNIPTTGLSVGHHHLFVRVIKANGTASIYDSKPFLVQPNNTNTFDIVEAEYYIDTDPGIGSGTIVDVADVADLNANLSVVTTGLSVGTHHLFVRVKNANNKWSLYDSKPFMVQPNNTNSFDIVEAEYYIDTDPGIGNGTIVDVADVADLNANLSVVTTGLSVGMHHLFVRVKNANNKWSLYDSKPFLVQPDNTNTSNIIEAEYFIDADPGIGNGTALTVSGNDVDTVIPITTQNTLPDGQHVLFVRVKNANNKWSLYARSPFESSGALGNDSFEISKISIYPNPTADFVNIVVSDSNKLVSVKMYDFNGKQVYSTTSLDRKIDISNFAIGTYILLLETEKGNLTKKVIKK